jgi:hypothetical protein
VGGPVGTLAVQYLEDGPGVAAIDPEEARSKLRSAFERLPLSYVLIGWNLPQPVQAACREETTQRGAQLFRWHPLLTGERTLIPRPEWRTIGLQGGPVPGFQDMPEFTFVCPNRADVREAVLSHLSQVLQRGDYDGYSWTAYVFLRPQPTRPAGWRAFAWIASGRPPRRGWTWSEHG